MLLDCLALANDVHSFLSQTWSHIKHSLRDWLGPGARNWYLTSDFQITHIPVPDSLFFCPIQNLICKIGPEFPNRRTKRLPWLAICAKNGEDTWDFSDWLSEVRIATECPTPPLIQIVRLASRINNIHVFESNHTTICLTNSEGEDEVYTFKGSLKLEKI